MKDRHTRRRFLQTSSIGAGTILAGAGKSLAQGKAPAASETGYVKVGGNRRFQLALASYTLRNFSLEETIEMTQRVALENISLKSFHLPLDSSRKEIRAAAAKVRAAGLNLYGGGVIKMTSKETMDQAFEYAKAAGFKTIIGVPGPDLLDLANEKVAEYDIQIAIHNHGPGDDVWPVPSVIHEKIKHLDKRIGLCVDIGHTQRMGVDPAESIRKYSDRVLDIHLKDVSSATKEGKTVEIGRGVIDIPKVLRTMIDVGYSDMAAFEYEKDKEDPLAGLAESVGYVRGALKTI
ncbi:MAG: sugar phosphate isomerase/epimerase [Planctomycetes bacterium]|nr:sugar phosphate isomerase/epimerase [Planctomycetota bacterium]